MGKKSFQVLLAKGKVRPKYFGLVMCSLIENGRKILVNNIRRMSFGLRATVSLRTKEMHSGCETGKRGIFGGMLGRT